MSGETKEQKFLRERQALMGKLYFKMQRLIKANPNNQQLGEKIRELQEQFNKYKY